MRLVLDACIIYPTIMREILMDCAQNGLFEPIWSARIIEEWLHAAAKLGEGGRVVSLAEAAQMADQFPKAQHNVPVRDDLWLPDPDDVHVLAVALEAGADAILTANIKDFPLRALRPFGVGRLHPDAYLTTESDSSDVVWAAVDRVMKKAEAISGRELPVRPTLKRAGLPRLGRAYSRLSDHPSDS